MSSRRWLSPEERDKWGEKLTLPEFDDLDSLLINEDICNKRDKNNYRTKNGWCGRDLCHSQTSPVRIIEYRFQFPDESGDERNNQSGTEKRKRQGGAGTTLTGVVHFTDQAESHKGFCHGGSMCSILDDVIGHCAFVVTGEYRPWSGFTAQISTSLKKPIPVNTFLKIRATVSKWEGRKVYVAADLTDPNGDIVHATGDGLVILNRDVLDTSLVKDD